MLTPRPYQLEAVEACNEHLATRQDNPCIVLPTGSGKSLVMAYMLHQWITAYPQFRAIILAHRKELVSQNAAELHDIDPMLPVGVFSAALGQRDTQSNIIFAGIDSVAKKSDCFLPFDIIIVDESHRIPAKGEGKYRKFIDAEKQKNPNLRVVGLTATPYRMGVGSICHKDHILNHVCYDANLSDLIREGYLSQLRTVKGDADIDLQGVKKSAGDFNLKDLALRVDKADVVSQAVNHMVKTCRREMRKSIIVFCIDIEHCRHVQKEMVKYGIDARTITGKTPKGERDHLVEEFKAGRLQWLLSVNVFLEGFNAKCVDCVAMLRPTKSKGLWVQVVGRGLRLHPGKEFCLVLDYGQNIQTHGPIDLTDEDDVKLATCAECGNEFSRARGECPSCGWVIPPQQREMFAQAEERERSMHSAKAGDGMLLSEDHWLDVDAVTCRLHRKAGKPDSVRIEYHCGLTTVNEWVCVDHPGYAWEKADVWMAQRGIEAGTVADFLAQDLGPYLNRITPRILVGYNGKHLNVKKAEIFLDEDRQARQA